MIGRRSDKGIEWSALARLRRSVLHWVNFHHDLLPCYGLGRSDTGKISRTDDSMPVESWSDGDIVELSSHWWSWSEVTVARDSWQSRSLSDSEALPVTLWQSVWLCRWVRVLSIRKFASSVEDLQNTLADFVPVIVDCLDSSVPSVAGDFLLKASAC